MINFTAGDMLPIKTSNKIVSENGAEIVNLRILAICGDNKEYLVHVPNNEIESDSDAIICLEDWQDVGGCYTIVNNMNDYGGASAAWIRPKYVGV